MTSAFVVPSLSMLVGWIGLWPVRRHLGTVGYHLTAFPIGLLGWSVGAVVSTTIGRPFDAISSGVGVVAYVTLLWVLGFSATWRSSGAADLPPVNRWSFVAAGGAFLTATYVLAASRLTIASVDSWMAYWPQAIELARNGRLQAATMSSRGVPLIAVGAAEVVFGGDWAYVVYPLMALSLLVILGALLLYDLRRPAGKVAAGVATIAAALLLVTDPTFLFNSFYAHSHMASALYLLVALGALRMAVVPEEGCARAGAGGWLMVAGTAAAGLALIRPDGLAYVFLPAIVAIALLTDGSWGSAAGASSFFVPLLSLVYGVYGAAFLELGLWRTNKLSGTVAAVILVALGLTVAVPRMVTWLRDRNVDISGERFLGVATGALAAVFVLALTMRWESAWRMLTHLYINSFQGIGLWGYFWHFAVALLVVSIATGDALRHRSWSRVLFFAILAFLLISAIVNSSRGGRPGPGDSLNRIMFHVVPLVVWYAGVVVGPAVRRLADGVSARSPERLGRTLNDPET